MKMKYNKQKIEEGCHEMMKMRLCKLEETLDPNMHQLISVKNVVNMIDSIQRYSVGNRLASDFIDTSCYESNFFNLLENLRTSLIIKPKSEKEMKDYLKKPIEDFDITSNLVRDSLKREKINTVGDLASRTEPDIYSLKGVGDLNFKILRKILREGGLDFKGN